MTRVFSLIVALLFSVALFAQDDEMSRAAQRAAELRSSYNGSFSHNAPGAKIEFREIESGGSPGIDLHVKYEMFVSGLPKDSLYDVADWLNYAERPKTEIIGVSLDPDGRVICKGEAPDQCKFSNTGRAPVDLTLTKIDPGQPFRFAVFSGPSRLAVVAAAVPAPIQAQDGPCHVEAIRLMRHFEVALLKVTGFAPSSSLALDGVSYGERHTGTLRSDGEGKAEIVLLPFVKGHTSGTSEMTVTDGRCAPKITFEWGTSAVDNAPKQ